MLLRNSHVRTCDNRIQARKRPMSRLSKIAGIKGPYLSLAKKLGVLPCAVTVLPFGDISTVAEIKNIHDNFAVGEMRDSTIEAALRTSPTPVVIDCGVNVGITVRWWFQFNNACRVIGVDMIEEAHTFTRSKLAGLQLATTAVYLSETGALGTEHGGEVEISFDDPLFGENAVTNTSGHQRRRVRPLSLNGIVAQHSLTAVTLLKIDIEGFGGNALIEGGDCLAKVQHVIFESHSESELKLASKILGQNGFQLRRFRNRNSFWERGN